jgi:glycosyltransferase involved in cell wall biosynthesis
VTHEIAKRLVARGHSVEWFGASFPGGSSEEEVDGIRIIRAGRQWTVHWHAFSHYHGSMRARFDAVIDEVNTMPFFTPLWAGIPTFMLMFQLAREVWWYESGFPINAIGYAAEPMYLLGYRHTPVFTISKSTEQDLRRLGFRGPITLIPIGVEHPVSASYPKAGTPTFLYVGRLAPSKRVEDILRALALYRQTTGTGSLLLVGTGSERYRNSLESLARQLNIDDSVSFLGRVSVIERQRLMAEAHALLMTSVREGWGLVVTEANACGTPAVVYDVPGLRDSVRNEATGLVVAPHPTNLAAAMNRITTDANLYSRLASEGRRWSRTFSFDDAAQLVGQAIEATGR